MKDHQGQEAAEVHLPKWMRLFIQSTVGWFEMEEDCQIHIKCNIIFPAVTLALLPWQSCLQRLKGMSWWAAAAPLVPAPIPSSEVLPHCWSSATSTTHLCFPLYLISSPYDSLGSNHFGCFQQVEVHFPPTILWLFQNCIFAKMWLCWGSPWRTNYWILFTLALFLYPFLGTCYWPRLKNRIVGYQDLYKIIPVFLSFYNVLFLLFYNKCKTVWVSRLYHFQEKECFFFQVEHWSVCVYKLCLLSHPQRKWI